MTDTEISQVRGAFQRARGRASLVHYIVTTGLGYDVYSVSSVADVDTAYSVTVIDGTYRCTCPAADNGAIACWHRASVFSRRASRQAHGLPLSEQSWAEAAGMFKPETKRPRFLPPREEVAS